MGMNGDRGGILVVDDTPENLTILEMMLEPLEHEVTMVSSGEDALIELRDNDYELVVLDVHMPAMDGYETAESIRSTARNQAVPIVFVSAVYGDKQHQERAFSIGASDFLTRPFDPSLFRGKIQALLDLQAVNAIQAARIRELEEALHEKSEMLGFVAHELKNPLAVVGGTTELILEHDIAPEDGKRLLNLARRQIVYMREMIHTLLTTAKVADSAGDHSTRVNRSLMMVMGQLADQHGGAESRIRISCPGNIAVKIDPDAYRLVLINLLNNALAYAKPGSPVDVVVRVEHGSVITSVTNMTDDVPAAERERLLAPFTRGGAVGKDGHGLGLHIANRFTKAFGGVLRVDWLDDSVTFRVELAAA